MVGVLATANTFKGSLYRDTVLKYASGVRIIEKVGWGLVEAVERGEIPSDLIERYVSEMTGEGADVIVLGCTHFPFLQQEIASAAGPSVRIINPAPAVARQTRLVLDTLARSRDGVQSSCVPAEKRISPLREFYSTGDTAVLQRTVETIDPSVPPEGFHHIIIQ